jgi:hypothetical protein
MGNWHEGKWDSQGKSEGRRRRMEGWLIHSFATMSPVQLQRQVGRGIGAKNRQHTCVFLCSMKPIDLFICFPRSHAGDSSVSFISILFNCLFCNLFLKYVVVMLLFRFRFVCLLTRTYFITIWKAFRADRLNEKTKT